MSPSGFIFIPPKQEANSYSEWLDLQKWNAEHQGSKPSEDDNLPELDKLRKRAQKGELW